MSDLKIKKENLPIQKDSGLIDISKFNVIVGENGSGKTRFFEQLEKDLVNDEDVEVISILANNTIPSEGDYKYSAESAPFIIRVSKLLKALGIVPKISNSVDIEDTLNDLFEKTNINMADFIGSSDIKVNHKIDFSKIKTEIIIKSIISDLVVDENGEELKVSCLGQGYQRLLIAAILKAYADKEISSDKKILILFEEPELFLHPNLKKTLNQSLYSLSEKDNISVVISTHDPYFIYSNKGQENVKVYSFNKNQGITTITEDSDYESGIIDEITHIVLFNKMMDSLKSQISCSSLGRNMETTSTELVRVLDDNTLEDIRVFQFVDGKDYNVILPIYIRNTLHHKDEQFTHDDLEKSIKIMSKIITNIV